MINENELEWFRLFYQPISPSNFIIATGLASMTKNMKNKKNKKK